MAVARRFEKSVQAHSGMQHEMLAPEGEPLVCITVIEGEERISSMRDFDDQHATGAENAMQFTCYAGRLHKVLEHMEQRHGIQRVVFDVRETTDDAVTFSCDDGC